MIKRILAIIATLCSVNFAMANSCIMVSPQEIGSVTCADNNVASFHILSTLMNEKKSLIVTSLSDGEINFTINLKNKKCDYKAKVSNGKLEIKGDKFIKILDIDLPPEALEGVKAE